MSEFKQNSINNVLIEIFEDILNLLDEKSIELPKKQFFTIENSKSSFSFEYDLFEDDTKFYQMLSILYNDNSNSQERRNIMKIGNNKLQKNLLPIYINYLIKILKNNKDAYKNSILKINILIFIDYIKNQSGDILILSEDYFFLSINELEAIYHDNQVLNELSEVIKLEYYKYKSYMLESLAVSDIPKAYRNNFEIIKKKRLLLEDFNLKKINIINFDDYLNNYNDYIQIQLDSIGKSIGIKNDPHFENFDIKNSNGLKNANLKKYLFELEDLKEIIAFITKFPDLAIPIEALLYLKENNFKLVNNLNDIISEILFSEEFYYKLKEILNSDVIKEYFNHNRKFKDVYGTELCSPNESNIDLKKAYEEFMQNYSKEPTFLIKLIIFKDLPKGKRSFVNQIPKIFLSTLFIQVNNEPCKNNINEYLNNLKIIISAYLIIILIHEIINLLKFIKDKQDKKVYESISDLPLTPKGRDGGKVFINYLFQKHLINEITINQANKILDINNWKNIKNLNKIFVNPEDDLISNSQIFSIKYYISDEKKEENKSYIDID